MDYIVVGAVAFIASGLTLYSGFGLGTILLPAFLLFFPVPVAIAATAVVHLLSNLFKGGLLGRHADWRIVARFGIPAIPATVAGAWTLGVLGETDRVFSWTAFDHNFGPTGAGLLIGVMLVLLASLELQPWFQRLAAPARMLPLGGAVTGFIGGLTGQQGAFRSIFLLKSGLAPRQYIATGVSIAILIDLARLPIYAASFGADAFGLNDRGWALVGFGTLCAFAGAFLGTRFVEKVTIAGIRVAVATLMFIIGAALVAGLIGS